MFELNFNPTDWAVPVNGHDSHILRYLEYVMCESQSLGTDDWMVACVAHDWMTCFI